jgi:hypothetical protein
MLTDSSATTTAAFLADRSPIRSIVTILRGSLVQFQTYIKRLTRILRDRL